MRETLGCAVSLWFVPIFGFALPGQASGTNGVEFAIQR